MNLNPACNILGLIYIGHRDLMYFINRLEKILICTSYILGGVGLYVNPTITKQNPQLRQCQSWSNQHR